MTIDIPCRLCGERQSHPLFTARGWPIVRCAVCGFQQVAKVPSNEELNAIYADKYFAKGKYVDDLAGRREQQRRLDLLRRAGCRPGGRVLDFGCATGEFMAAAEGSYEMWGLDVSAEAVRQAQAALPHLADRLRVWTPENVDFAPQTFDAVVLWDVIEHIPEPISLLKQWLPVLKPGGLLAVSTPDSGALTARMMKARWHFMTPPEHLCFFDEATLRRLFGTIGVEYRLSCSLGKWVNAAFLFYKAGRVFPELITPRMVTGFAGTGLARLNLYIPTADILYMVGQVPEAHDLAANGPENHTSSAVPGEIIA
jgi:2-polyprenyl-3-methyl-5-hydroxy-6-metoxy-1,4-benzoquinol methylase